MDEKDKKITLLQSELLFSAGFVLGSTNDNSRTRDMLKVLKATMGSEYFADLALSISEKDNEKSL